MANSKDRESRRGPTVKSTRGLSATTNGLVKAFIPGRTATGTKDSSRMIRRQVSDKRLGLMARRTRAFSNGESRTEREGSRRKTAGNILGTSRITRSMVKESKRGQMEQNTMVNSRTTKLTARENTPSLMESNIGAALKRENSTGEANSPGLTA